MTTAIETLLGGAVTVSSSSTVPLRPDKRCWFIDAGAALNATLPVVRVGSNSGPRVFAGGLGAKFLVFAKTNTVTIKDSAGSTIGTIAAGNAGELFLIDDSTVAGTWLLVARSTWTKSANIAAVRRQYRILLRQSSNTPFVVQSYLSTVLGWDGVTPVAVYCEVGTLGATTSIARGSNNAALPALDTGTLPAGSTFLLVVNSPAYIVGAGGTGGLGFGGTTAVAGTNGGPALRLNCTHAIANFGAAIGGGGGGGGGGAGTTAAGGGGGGGAGYTNGHGGQGGTLGGIQAQNGQDSTVAGGGPGGSPLITGGSAGGAGGNLGSNGVAGSGGGAIGGTAGSAILYAVGLGGVNFLTTGTVLGAQTSF